MYDKTAMCFAWMLPTNDKYDRFIIIYFCLLVLVRNLQYRYVKISEWRAYTFKSDEFVR